MKRAKKEIILGTVLIGIFAVWTVLVSLVDVRAIGPENSSVGFATVNRVLHGITGVNFTLYTITDWLGLVPFAVAFGFAMLGLVQWVKRGRLFSVDQSLLALGVFYLAVILVYILFEIIAVNYRPVLINGRLEASYPSSTTVLVCCVIPTALMQITPRITGKRAKVIININSYSFVAFTVVGRILSGVHWITDIIGGGVLSAGLVIIYHGYITCFKNGTLPGSYR